MNSPHIHIPYFRFYEYLDLIKEKSLNLELYFPGNALDQIKTDDLKKLKDMLDYNPSISFHAPFLDLSPGAVDSLIREATIKRLNQILDAAEILRPKAIVCHSGYEKWRYSLKPGWWLEQSLLTWRPLNRRAEDIGVKLAIENIFEDDPSNLRMLMEVMQSGNFGICFDTGHCNLFSSVELEEWMKSLNPYIIELHLHDNDRSSDQHLPVGDGSFDFVRFFRLLNNRDCIYTVEAHTPEDVMRSVENIAKLRETASGF